jgi:hypothetical protein
MIKDVIIRIGVDAGGSPGQLGRATVQPPKRDHESRRNELQSVGMKRIVIFATFHEVQIDGHPRNGEFAERLSYLIEKLAAKIVLEEWSENRPFSFARAFAKSRRCIWENVGTPTTEDFKTHSIALVHHPGHDGTLPADESAPSMSEHGPFEQQEDRERRMVENIRTDMESCDVGLFIVGLAHLHSMGMKLQAAGFDVVGYSWL